MKRKKKTKECKVKYVEDLDTGIEVSCAEIKVNEYRIYARGKQSGWSKPIIKHDRQKAIDCAKNSKQKNKNLEIIVIEHNKETNSDFPIDIEI